MNINSPLLGAEQVPLEYWLEIGQDSYEAVYNNRTFKLHHDSSFGQLELEVLGSSILKTTGAYQKPKIIQGKPTYPVSRFLDLVRDYINKKKV
ncbi:hypothetical protein COV12_02465 [Candidatus Woesearchaeota archaeon CG10_big_fil_rev_8_21_14_0_10_32_24]|nr:MAG: hypothetical protein COV12_02465 [Candidatus Woesearchaeota archaeon CG10_big_fil_rev_8_21_14_0_10_32_24]